MLVSLKGLFTDLHRGSMRSRLQLRNSVYIHSICPIELFLLLVDHFGPIRDIIKSSAAAKGIDKKTVPIKSIFAVFLFYCIKIFFRREKNVKIVQEKEGCEKGRKKLLSIKILFVQEVLSNFNLRLEVYGRTCKFNYH